MGWNKPRNVWQWLLLLSPAAAAIFAAQMAKWWLPPIPPLHFANGMVIADIVKIGIRFAKISLAVILVGSAIFAFLLSREQKPEERVSQIVVWMLCLSFMNSFVAFGGCAFLGVPNSDPHGLVPVPVGVNTEKSPAQP